MYKLGSVKWMLTSVGNRPPEHQLMAFTQLAILKVALTTE